MRVKTAAPEVVPSEFVAVHRTVTLWPISISCPRVKVAVEVKETGAASPI